MKFENSPVMQKILAKGRQNGQISMQEISVVLADDPNLGPDEMEDILSVLAENGVRVVEAQRPVDAELEADLALLEKTADDFAIRQADSDSVDGIPVEDSIRLYIHQISQTPLLTVTEEQNLGRRIAQAREHGTEDKAAKQQMVAANMRLVISIAQQYTNRGMTMQDIIQEGSVGLINAVDKFDYRKNIRFSGHATWWIRQAINRAIQAQTHTIRIPAHMSESISDIIRTSHELAQKLGREPRPDEIAEASGLSVDRVDALMRIVPEPLSFEAPFGEDENSRLADVLEDREARAPEDAATALILHEEIEALLGQLGEREQEVLRMRYGIGVDRIYTLEEVAEHLKVSRERIRDIEARSIKKLQSPETLKKLSNYLEN